MFTACTTSPAANPSGPASDGKADTFGPIACNSDAQCPSGESCTNATCIPDWPCQPASAPLLANAQQQLCTMLTSTAPLAAADATNLLAAITSAEVTQYDLGAYIWEVQATPTALAEIAQNRTAVQFETDARRALTRVQGRIGDDFEGEFPTSWAYTSVAPRATVPAGAQISTEAYAQDGSVDPRLDPSQWLPWLDTDRDGFVSGAEYDAWSATFHVEFLENIVPHPSDPTDAGTMESLGMTDKLVPLAFYTIEQALEASSYTGPAQNAVVAPVDGSELPVLARVPGSVADDIAFFRVSYYFSSTNTYSNALGLTTGQPSGVLGSVVDNFPELYPIDFGVFDAGGGIMYADTYGLHHWNATTNGWDLAIARPQTWGLTEDNGGFVVGSRIFQFHEEPEGEGYALGVDYYDLGDGQFHASSAEAPDVQAASRDDLVSNVVVIGTIAYVQLALDPRIHAFDTQALTWSLVPADPLSQVLSVLAARDGQLLRIGGGQLVEVNGQPYVQPTYAIQAYDPSAGTWSVVGTVPRHVDSRDATAYVIDGNYAVASRLYTEYDAAVNQMPGFAYVIAN